MSQQKTIRKSVKIAVTIAVIVFAVAGIVLAIPQLVTTIGYSYNSKDVGGNHISDPSTSNGGIQVGKEMKTKDNTNCVNPPGGPQIC